MVHISQLALPSHQQPLCFALTLSQVLISVLLDLL